MKNTDKVTMEIRKLYLTIRTDWNLSGKLLKDFISVSLIEFKNENKSLNNFEDKIIEEFSKDLINKIYSGMNFYLGKFGVSHLSMILKKWIEQSIDDEVDQRVRDSTRGIGEKCPKNDDITSNDAAGGIVYIQ